MVPATSSPAHRLDFERGLPFFGEGPDGSPKSSVEEWLRASVSAPSPTPRIFCMEDAVARRTDGAVERLLTEKKAFFCGDAVYWYGTADSPQDSALRASARWDPNIAMVTTPVTGQKNIEHRDFVSPAMLERMAAAALAVIIGAWDADGFVVWEPPNAKTYVGTHAFSVGA